jgi:acetyltransferase-like isoleucine patch superfamily enzyme
MIYKAYKHFYLFGFRLFNRRKFKKLGKNIKLLFPLVIEGKQYIEIQDNVNLAKGIYLAATNQTGHTPEIIIGRGTRLGNFNHIYATRSIVIGENVLTSERVYISDNLHNYTDINRPIIAQEINQVSNVRIGSGSWLGQNVCVIGCSIGKNCVIGANAVVTRDIPDYCVAVGIPAKVIKKYNPELKLWQLIE